MKRVIRRKRLYFRISMMFIALLLLLSVAIGTIIYNISMNNTIERSKLILESSTRYVADIYDGEDMRKLRETADPAMYMEWNVELGEIRESFNLDSLYIFCPIMGEDGRTTDDVVYLYDLMKSRRETGIFRGFLEPSSNEKFKDIANELFDNGRTLRNNRSTAGKDSEILSYFQPLYLSDGTLYAIVGADILMSGIRNAALDITIRIIGASLLIIIVFAVFFIVYIKRHVIDPVSILSDHMNRFVHDSNNLNYIPVTEIKTNDELQSLGDYFNSMAEAILEYADNLEKDTEKRERIKIDRDVTAQLRMTVSSSENYPTFPERSDFDLCISLKNTSCGRFSYCNYFLRNENDLFIAIGESAGSSLAAMLILMLAATNIECYAKMGYSPYRAVIETNNRLCSLENHDRSLTVGMLAVHIDLRSGVMRYVNAGMPPVLIKRTGEPFVPEAPQIRYNLGEMRGVPVTEETVKLNQGVTVVFTSYGVGGTLNPQGEEFTEERLVGAVNEITGETCATDRMVFELEERLAKFRGIAPADTDTTIAVFRYFD